MLKKGDKITIYKDQNRWSVSSEITNIVLTEDIIIRLRNRFITYKNYFIYINKWTFMQDKETVYVVLNGDHYKSELNINLHKCFLKIII